GATAHGGRGRTVADLARLLPSAVRPVAVHAEPIDRSRLPRLDPQRELRRQEMLAVLVQQHRVRLVAIGKVHTVRYEDVGPAVGVDVVDARAPWPVGLDADAIAHFLKRAA